MTAPRDTPVRDEPQTAACEHRKVAALTNWTDDGQGGTKPDGVCWYCDGCGIAFVPEGEAASPAALDAPLHGHNYGGDWIECTDTHAEAASPAALDEPTWWSWDTEDDDSWLAEFGGEDIRALVRERNRLLAEARRAEAASPAAPDWCGLIGSFMGVEQYCGEPSASAWHQPGEWFKHEFVPLTRGGAAAMSKPRPSETRTPIFPRPEGRRPDPAPPPPREAASPAALDPWHPDGDCLMPSACGVTGYYCYNWRAASPAALDVERLRETIHRMKWCKATETLHAFAHGDDPEDDELRARFMAEYARLTEPEARG